MPAELPQGRRAASASTQEAFGRIMGELAKSELPLARRIVTTARRHGLDQPAGWVGRLGVFGRSEREDVFRSEQVVSPTSPGGSPARASIPAGHRREQPVLNLASLGVLAHELLGARLIPIGTLYDPFIARGLDAALTYACYQDARFILRDPLGHHPALGEGAHQIGTPLIGMSQPGSAISSPPSPTRWSSRAGRSPTSRSPTAARPISG
ncbi:MAG: hypothetical protein U1E17_09015 [Geminicoccaceae bacterium]